MICWQIVTQEIIHGSTDDSVMPGDEGKGVLKSIAGSVEWRAIIEVLEKVSYNKSKAAEQLNIDRKTRCSKVEVV